MKSTVDVDMSDTWKELEVLLHIVSRQFFNNGAPFERQKSVICTVKFGPATKGCNLSFATHHTNAC